MLKTLYEEIGDARRLRSPPRATSPSRAIRRRRTRRRAARATIPPRRRFLSRTRLNRPGSEKETWHVEFDLARCGLDYTVGDSFGLFPTNDPALVDADLRRSARRRISRSAAARLREVLTDGVSLSPAPDMLFQLFSYITGGERRQKAKALASGEDPDGDAATLDVLAALEKFPASGPIPKPSSRRWSRCSRGSIRSRRRRSAIPGRVSLTVDAVRYDDRQAQAARRRLDLPRRAHHARRHASRSTCRRRTPSACRPIRRCRSS